MTANKIIAFFFLFFLLSGVCHARVESAKIFPRGSIIQQSQPAQSGRNTFYLPGDADPDTLSVSVANNTFAIGQISWKKEQKRNPEKIRKLRNRLEGLKLDRKKAQAELRTLNKQIDFWEVQIGRKWDTAQDALKMGESFVGPLSGSYLEKIDTQGKIRDIKEKIRKVKQKLQELTGRDNKHWRVELGLSGPASRDTRIYYSYFYPGAGYESSYIHRALPRKQKIAFTWHARISQQTGKDWKDAEIILATLRPSFELVPPSLKPWIIEPEQQNAKASDSRARLMAESAGVVNQKSPARAPEKQTKSTYAEWNLGRLDLPSKSPQRVKLKQEDWTAEFVHLLRPQYYSRAFVMAEPRLEQARQIPEGSAQFFLQGSLVGKDDFGLQGNHTRVYFGQDPLVRVRFDVGLAFSERYL